MAYDPNLNRLIALGGTYNPSPVKSYYGGRDDRTSEDMNRLNMESTRQTMGIQVDQNARQQKIMKMKQRDNFGTSVAPIMQEILNEPNAIKQQAMYQKAIPLITRSALENNIPTANMSTVFDPVKANQVVQNYGAEQFEEVIKAGQPVAQRNLKTRRVVAHPEAPTKVMEGGPGDFGIGDKDLVKLTEKRRINEQTLLKSVHAMRRLEKIVSNDAFVGGITGDAVSMVNSLTSQAEQLLGMDSIVDDSGNIKESEIDPKSKQLGSLRKKAIQGDAYSAALIELAYVKAKLVDPASKITDKDFDFARKMLASGADKASIINTLRMQSKFSIENYNQEERTAKGRFKRYTPSMYSEAKYRDLYNVEAPVQLDENSTPDDFARDMMQGF